MALRCVAVFDCEAEDPAELSFVKGDILVNGMV